MNRYFVVQTLSLALNISDSLLTIHKINGSMIKVYFSCDLYSSKDLPYQIQTLIDHYYMSRVKLMTYFSLPLIEISIIRMSKQTTTTKSLIELRKAFITMRPAYFNNQTVTSSRNNLFPLDQFNQPLVIVPLIIILTGLIICTIIAFCLCCNNRSSSSSSTLLLSNGSFATPSNKHLYQRHRQQQDVYQKRHYFKDQRQFISKGKQFFFSIIKIINV